MISAYTKEVVRQYIKSLQHSKEGYDIVFIDSQNTVIVDDKLVSKYFLHATPTSYGSYYFRYYHYDSFSREFTDRAFTEIEKTYIMYLLNNRPDKLKELIDSGKFYLVLSRQIYKAQKLVEQQLDDWLKVDKEIEIARRNNDEDRFYRLKNNLRARAEEEIYRAVLFV